MVSPHKSDLFAELASQCPALEWVCCADQPLSQDRLAMGWAAKEVEGYRLVVAPTEAELLLLANDMPAETLHVFSGIRWVPSIVAALKAVKASGARFGIMSEPRVSEGFAGFLRYAQSWLTEGWIRRRTQFVLAIGRNGPPWFRLVGYPRHKLVPFAYFVYPPVAAPYSKPAQAIRIGFLGRLVPMKGVFDLLDAVASLAVPCTLSFAGQGASQSQLEAAAERRAVQVDFKGVLPLGQTGAFLTGLDVLVLASTTKDDGWGVVVSEALMVGTAVVATHCVGASVVLDDALLGRVVAKHAPEEIANAIMAMHAAGGYSTEARQRRALRAKQLLSAQAGARHLLKVITWVEGEGRLEKPDAYYSAASTDMYDSSS